MNKLYLLIGMFIVFGCSGDKKNKEELLADIEYQDTFDFGEMQLKDTVNHVFEITNVSDIPLKITKIGTSCGCTAAVITDSIVEKGEKAKIEVSFHSKEDVTGEVKNSIVVEANTKPSYNVFYLTGIIKE